MTLAEKKQERRGDFFRAYSNDTEKGGGKPPFSAC